MPLASIPVSDPTSAPPLRNAYDVHVAILPRGRGAWAREAADEAMRHMFETVGAELLVFRVPAGNLAASALARMLGAEFLSVTAPVWPTRAGPLPLKVFYLTRRRWLARTGRGH